MSSAVVPIGCEGAKVRLFPGFGWWRAVNPNGRLGRNFDAENMLFDAGRSIRSGDLVAGFWREEAEEMDWLEDFLCDPSVDQMIEVLMAPEEEEEEEPSFQYSKHELTTFGSDVMDPN